jgi:RNA recognition motif-containing protein
MSAKVFVGNLSYETTKAELTGFLSAAGTIVDVHLPTDRETQRPRGFAFVQFSTEAEATQAIQLFDARELGGRRLKVNAAEARPPGPPGPRPFRPAGPPPGVGRFGSDGPPRAPRFKTKGSRRGLRARKRSL